MRFVLALIAALMAQTSFASETLHCSEAIGGPSPATAVIQIDPEQDNRYTVTIQYVNPSYPQGTNGSYIAQYDPSSRELRGTGNLATFDSSFFFDVSTQGRFHLSIYAGGDQGNRSIEFGFGVHLLCK